MGKSAHAPPRAGLPPRCGSHTPAAAYDKTKLRAVFGELAIPDLIVIAADQPNTISGLCVALA
ncbi:hypothetical protein [Mycobacterium spongiae]|uniref:Uncharacterized protein n=1 Tax=Mycobacterium spongiae TaxID=886343 RepID=A0A975PVI6_9MYCO|nr:hypothetical protein [Mycobacterium spongiae]QUR66191.1 hypothetical protein F6B93_03015 [Mycobacterium spongiae]